MDEEGLWVAQALRGDQQAFAHLVDTYQAPVYNLCYRMLGSAPEAEDAAQETFVRMYKHLRAYDPQQKLSSWILAVASHYCIDRLRRRRIKWLSLDDILPTLSMTTGAVPPEVTAIEHESCSEVRDLLQTLPAAHRLVIVLRYWYDLSYAEIAQVVGTTESAIKSRLHRARKTMAEAMLARTKQKTGFQASVPEGKKVTDHALL